MSEGIRRALLKISRARMCGAIFLAMVVGCALGVYSIGWDGQTFRVLIVVCAAAAPASGWVLEWIFEVNRTSPELANEREG